MAPTEPVAIDELDRQADPSDPVQDVLNRTDPDWDADKLLNIAPREWRLEINIVHMLEHLRDLDRITTNIRANRAVQNTQVADNLTVQQQAIVNALNLMRRQFPEAFDIAREAALDDAAQLKQRREARRTRQR